MKRTKGRLEGFPRHISFVAAAGRAGDFSLSFAFLTNGFPTALAGGAGHLPGLTVRALKLSGGPAGITRRRSPAHVPRRHAPFPPASQTIHFFGTLAENTGLTSGPKADGTRFFPFSHTRLASQLPPLMTLSAILRLNRPGDKITPAVRGEIPPLFGGKGPKIKISFGRLGRQTPGGRQIFRHFRGTGFEHSGGNRLAAFEESLECEEVGRNTLPPRDVEIAVHLFAGRRVLGTEMGQQSVFQRLQFFRRKFLNGRNRNQ